ncbi:hypothetical protein [Polycladomyces subterraneus]|uniref:Uncharacterized protein n=1 Tax=Polycladomyces subterraneus TaxID=1016997 RepID=A0ABT8IJN9_9BACL|nr:hypothetical protein [Polycladomyces subterraneus]MDN4592998.1 hypothetical protein [Polycladomyces subterraneus]
MAKQRHHDQHNGHHTGAVWFDVCAKFSEYTCINILTTNSKLSFPNDE